MLIYKGTKINILLGDITEQKVDAIVNAANNTLLGGGGVDGSIHKKGGHTILEQCKKLCGCSTGEAKITTAGDLPSKYVIHTVGPVYKEGNIIMENLLYNSYHNSLKVALDYDIKTIAFPSISTGAYGYPISQAVTIALKAIVDFIDRYNNFNEISFILFSQEDFEIYKEYFNKYLNC